eukprot:TRINITY_DN17_c0_g1_i1.p1 TRINITY_DN17_c0_g1~~TRINITY_DN17_c0_g1_i1.p1  ORF type:complete len:776 (+),score=206.40 TRINITY_DN17_c0_g1_i1:52-2379(+)
MEDFARLEQSYFTAYREIVRLRELFAPKPVLPPPKVCQTPTKSIRPSRTAQKDRITEMLNKQKEHENKIEELRRLKEQNELKQLKGTPSINRNSKAMARKKRGIQDRSAALQREKEERLVQMRKQLEEKETAELKTPTINRKSKKMSRSVNMMMSWDKERSRKLEEARKLQKEREEKECKPVFSVNRQSEKILRRKRMISGNTSIPPTPAPERLHKDAMSRLEKNKQKAEQVNQQALQQMKPRLAPHSRTLERPGSATDRLYRSAQVKREKLERLRVQQEEAELVDKNTGKPLFRPTVHRSRSTARDRPSSSVRSSRATSRGGNSPSRKENDPRYQRSHSTEAVDRLRCLRNSPTRTARRNRPRPVQTSPDDGIPSFLFSNRPSSARTLPHQSQGLSTPRSSIISRKNLSQVNKQPQTPKDYISQLWSSTKSKPSLSTSSSLTSSSHGPPSPEHIDAVKFGMRELLERHQQKQSTPSSYNVARTPTSTSTGSTSLDSSRFQKSDDDGEMEKWEFFATADDYIYFYNKATNSTQWDKPACLAHLSDEVMKRKIERDAEKRAALNHRTEHYEDDDDDDEEEEIEEDTGMTVSSIATHPQNFRSSHRRTQSLESKNQFSHPHESNSHPRRTQTLNNTNNNKVNSLRNRMSFHNKSPPMTASVPTSTSPQSERTQRFLDHIRTRMNSKPDIDNNSNSNNNINPTNTPSRSDPTAKRYNNTPNQTPHYRSVSNSNSINKRKTAVGNNPPAADNSGFKEDDWDRIKSSGGQEFWSAFKNRM